MPIPELENIFAAYGLKETFYEQEALFHWEEVVGPNTARLTEPLSVSEGVLYIQVGNHVFAQEYTLMRDTWLKLLNQRLHQPLKDIRFKVATIDKPKPPPELPSVDDVNLDESEQAEVETLFEGLEDDSLKQAFMRVFETQQKAEKIRAELENQKQCPSCQMYHDGDGLLCPFCVLEGKEYPS